MNATNNIDPAFTSVTAKSMVSCKLNLSGVSQLQHKHVPQFKLGMTLRRYSLATVLTAEICIFVPLMSCIMWIAATDQDPDLTNGLTSLSTAVVRSKQTPNSIEKLQKMIFPSSRKAFLQNGGGLELCLASCVINQ